MNLNQQLQQINNKLDKCRRKLAAAHQRFDKPVQLQMAQQIEGLEKQIAAAKLQQGRELGSKGEQLKALEFSRALSKSEQADMGKLKKTVRGLVVVHPMTALGREMGVSVVTGFAPKPF